MKTSSLKKSQKNYLSQFAMMQFRLLPEEKKMVREFLKKKRLSMKDVFLLGLKEKGFPGFSPPPEDEI